MDEQYRVCLPKTSADLMIIVLKCCDISIPLLILRFKKTVSTVFRKKHAANRLKTCLQIELVHVSDDLCVNRVKLVVITFSAA